jgi:hypothetical protein
MRLHQRGFGAAMNSSWGRRTALVIGAVLAAAVGLLGGWVATRVALSGLRAARGTARFAFAVLTLRLYRRCPDCKTFVHHDARVCRYCGYRRRPGPRPS